MPDADLLSVQAVALSQPVAQILSRPGVRVNCDLCGEEIINEREVKREDLTLCRACAGQGYYQIPAFSVGSALEPSYAALN
jgi:formylmethanofuran dehydrogenase subunit E